MKPELVASVCLLIDNDANLIEPYVEQVSQYLAANLRYYEILLIDNHSTDSTASVVRDLLKRVPDLRLIRLTRHHTDEVAYAAGLDHCIGDIVAMLSVHMDPPELLERIFAELQGDCDIVIGRPTMEQSGGWFRKRVVSATRYMAARILGTQPGGHSGSCLGLTRRALNALTRIRSKSRFLLHESRRVGYASVVIPYNAVRPESHKLTALEFAYSQFQLIVAYSLRPLRAASLLGIIASSLNLVYLMYITAVVLIKSQIAEGWLTTSITHTIMFLLQFLILAILTEYVGRILEESKDQPLYFVEHELTSTVSSMDRTRLNVT